MENPRLYDKNKLKWKTWQILFGRKLGIKASSLKGEKCVILWLF
jgi:hypothetical protein